MERPCGALGDAQLAAAGSRDADQALDVVTLNAVRDNEAELHVRIGADLVDDVPGSRKNIDETLLDLY